MQYPIVYDKFETEFASFGLAVLNEAYKVKKKEKINGEYLLSLILPRNSEKWQHIQSENFIKVKEKLFRIRTLEELRDNSGKLLSNIQCEHVWYEANDCKYFPKFNMTGTPQEILIATFSGTRFTIDVVEITTQTTINLTKTNPAKIANELIKKVGGELKRDNWTISLLERVGANNGVQIRLGKNIKSLKKILDTSNLVTRLYPYGKDDIDIGSVNSGVEYIDSQYKNLYDYVHNGTKDYSDITDPVVLKEKALGEFSNQDKDGIDKPKLTLSTSLIELKKLVEYGQFETFDIGDTIKAIDENLNIDLNARIFEYEEYPYEVDDSSVILGNFKDNIGSFFAELVRSKEQLQNIITDTGQVKVSWLENIMAKLQTEIEEGITKRIAMHDYGDMWVDNLDNPTKALVLVNGMLAIANSKKENGDWDWRSFGTGDGFTADLINVGELNGQLIKANSISVGALKAGIINTDLIKLQSNDGSLNIVANEVKMINIDGSEVTLNPLNGLRVIFEKDGQGAPYSYTQYDAEGQKRYLKGNRVSTFFMQGSGDGWTANVTDDDSFGDHISEYRYVFLDLYGEAWYELATQYNNVLADITKTSTEKRDILKQMLSAICLPTETGTGDYTDDFISNKLAEFITTEIDSSGIEVLDIIAVDVNDEVIRESGVDPNTRTIDFKGAVMRAKGFTEYTHDGGSIWWSYYKQVKIVMTANGTLDVDY